jgi:hypothetical protein
MRSRAVALGLLLAVGAGPVGAQDTLSQARSGWLIGASFGVPGYGSDAIPELFTIGIHWTQLRPGRLGADFSIGTIPRIVVEGVAVLGFRAGGTLPLALAPRLVVLPSAGVSLIGGVGPGGGGGAGGLNAGVATVLFGTSSTGLRTGVTWHRFEDTGGALWLFEVGAVGIPGRSR